MQCRYRSRSYTYSARVHILDADLPEPLRVLFDFCPESFSEGLSFFSLFPPTLNLERGKTNSSELFLDTDDGPPVGLTRGLSLEELDSFLFNLPVTGILTSSLFGLSVL